MGFVAILAEHDSPPAIWRRWSESTSAVIPEFLLISFYIVLANIPYWIASRVFGFLPMGCFCVEYAIVGVIALFVPRFISAVLLLVAIFVDLLCGVCLSYSLPILESIQNVSAAHAFSSSRFLFALTATLLMVLVAIASAFLPGKFTDGSQRRRAAVFLAAFSIFLVGADILTVQFATGHLPQTLRSSAANDAVNLRISHFPRLARIPVIRLVRKKDTFEKTRALEMKGAASAFTVLSATRIAIRSGGIGPAATDNEQPNLVLVVLESWGLPQDSRLDRALTQAYSEPDLLSKYEVIRGTVPFYGPTIAGEARELCGNGIGFYLLVAPASDLRSCLPQRLAAEGYQNIALHGMSGKVFDREVWYRRIGFQDIWFNDRFKREGLPDCVGALIGTCDADIATWIGKRLEGDSPHPFFIHWMTLNSHLPVVVPSPLPNGRPCESSLSLMTNTPICSWYQLVANVHQSVAEVAMGPLARPTVFVIVGDHAPPFSDPELRSKFSETDVPYLVLLPRQNGSHSKPLLARAGVIGTPGKAKPSRPTP